VLYIRVIGGRAHRRPHSEVVLRNVLGLSETEIEELYRDKTIVRDPVLDGER
jgi:hypothetical protein